MVSLLARTLQKRTRQWLRGRRDRPVLERLREAHQARCADNYRNLVTRFPSVQGKTHFLEWFAGHGPDEIGDPYARGPAFGRRCCEQIMAPVDGLMKHVLSP